MIITKGYERLSLIKLLKNKEIYKKRICKIELYPCPETLVAVGGGGETSYK